MMYSFVSSSDFDFSSKLYREPLLHLIIKRISIQNFNRNSKAQKKHQLLN